MSERRRVAVLVKRFPRLSETFIMNEFLELRRRGVPVSLYAITDPGEAQAHPEALALVPEVVYLRTDRRWTSAVGVLRTVQRHPGGALRALAWAISAWGKVRVRARQLIDALVLVDRLAADGTPHLHAHFLHSPAAIAFIANKISGQRYSLSGHAKDIYTGRAESLRLRCASAEFVTTCTEANRRHLVHEIGLPADRVHLCRHGVDVKRFSDAPGPRLPGRIVSVGRLVPKKGHNDLIRACGELRRRGVEFQLRIVGSGPLHDELLQAAAQEDIADQVELPGAMCQEEVIRELGAAELFALSPVVMPDGNRDGIPNVLMEAMAAGLPVVASAVSGIPELLTDGVNARLVDPARPDMLADVLAELLCDGEQCARLSAAGRRFAIDECSWARAILPLALLLRVVSGAPSDQVIWPVAAHGLAS